MGLSPFQIEAAVTSVLGPLPLRSNPEAFEDWYNSLPTIQDIVATAPVGHWRFRLMDQLDEDPTPSRFLCPYFPDCATHRQAMVRALDQDVYP